MATRALGTQICHFLKSQGVEVIFGIPGVHNQELYRGFEETGLIHILARHEQGVGFMADGYARASGKPGIAFVITGPGLCNIMTPMGQAYSDSVPLLVISSCLDETAFRRGQLHQMLDQEGAARTVCEWSETAQNYQAAYGLLERSFQEFVSKRTRPKHIQIPISVLESQAPLFKLKNSAIVPSSQDKSAISGIVRQLSKAKRPLFILGGGAVKTNVQVLLERCKAAAFVTFAGRGLVDPSYPLYCGSSLARPETVAIIESADLVIVLGSELGEVDLWREKLGHKALMVRVDIDPQVLSDAQHAEVRVAMRAEEFVSLMLDELKSETLQSEWDAHEIKRMRKVWTAQADASYSGILPFIQGVKDAVHQDTLVYSDMTQFAYLAKEVWDMSKPSRWHHPYGFGTLGYALPAAIGGCLARPDLRVVAISGDYGFQYTLSELGVAAELGLSLPIIIWDNQKLKAIEDSMIGAQISPTAVQALNPDFRVLANAYGASFKKPLTVRDLKNDLDEAYHACKPTLIYLSSEDFTV